MQNMPCTLEEFRLFQLGQESAFRTIYEYYHPLLYRKICKFSYDVLEAEELTQEIFVQLFLRRSDIKSVEAIFPFLYTVAKRMSISSFRKRIVHLRYQQEELKSWNEGSLMNRNDIEFRELETILNKVITALPPQQQLIYRMNKLEDKSYDEIAEISGLSKYTVRNHLHLATKFVRFHLNKILLIIFLLKI